MKVSTLIRLGGGAIALAAASQAMAEGTLADTNVLNTATVNYSVTNNGVDVEQPPIDSNEVDFEVDRRINLTVAEVGNAYTLVSPGQTDQVLTYELTNLSNSIQDFRLTATPNGTDPFGGTDNFNADNIRVFVESGDNAGYQPGEDVLTFVDELAPDTSVTVYVLGDIPVAQVDGDVAAYTLTGIAAEPGTAGALGVDSAETAGAEDPNAVDTVFGDGAGDVDAANDGQFSDTDAYLVSSATVQATKSSIVVSDPVNLTTDPKRIPGATVQYCIEVENTGSNAATNVIVTDLVGAARTPPQPVTFVPGSIRINATSCTDTDGTAVTDDDDTDTGDFTGGTVTGELGTIAPGATERVQFSVLID